MAKCSHGLSASIQLNILQWMSSENLLRLKVYDQDRQVHKPKQLSNVLDISVEGPKLKDFAPDRAIDAWWTDCATTRRINQIANTDLNNRQVEPQVPQQQSNKGRGRGKITIWTNGSKMLRNWILLQVNRT